MIVILIMLFSAFKQTCTLYRKVKHVLTNVENHYFNCQYYLRGLKYTKTINTKKRKHALIKRSLEGARELRHAKFQRCFPDVDILVKVAGRQAERQADKQAV